MCAESVLAQLVGKVRRNERARMSRKRLGGGRDAMGKRGENESRNTKFEEDIN